MDILDLAKKLRGSDVGFCFGVRGNSAGELRAAIGPDDTNVRLAGFAPEADLTKRLTAADIHLVSLRPEWSGLVVPSKFFGALAAGRPVLFAGPRDAAIAHWIEEYGVGWVLDSSSFDEVAERLWVLARDPQGLAQLQQHCMNVLSERVFATAHHGRLAPGAARTFVGRPEWVQAIVRLTTRTNWRRISSSRSALPERHLQTQRAGPVSGKL